MPSPGALLRPVQAVWPGSPRHPVAVPAEWRPTCRGSRTGDTRPACGQAGSRRNCRSLRLRRLFDGAKFVPARDVDVAATDLVLRPGHGLAFPGVMDLVIARRAWVAGGDQNVMAGGVRSAVADDDGDRPALARGLIQRL